MDDDFTDLTMLLLTFFVLLVATSKQDTVKLSKMLEKFSDAQVDAKVMENTIPDISHEKMMKKWSQRSEWTTCIRS